MRIKSIFFIIDTYDDKEDQNSVSRNVMTDILDI